MLKHCWGSKRIESVVTCQDSVTDVAVRHDCVDEEGKSRQQRKVQHIQPEQALDIEAELIVREPLRKLQSYAANDHQAGDQRQCQKKRDKLAEISADIGRQIRTGYAIDPIVPVSPDHVAAEERNNHKEKRDRTHLNRDR